MADKTKKGKKMHTGPGWKITRGNLEFSGTLATVLHRAGKGKMVAIFLHAKTKDR